MIIFIDDHRDAYGVEPICRVLPIAPSTCYEKPLVDALRETLDAALRRLSPKSNVAKAIAYGTKRWPALCRFLDEGRLAIDNNIAERALRGVAVGRRNWLFTGSKTGGERAAASYTVIQTARPMASTRRPTSPTSLERCS